MSKSNRQEVTTHKKWIRWHQAGVDKCTLEIEGYRAMAEYHRWRIKIRQGLIDGKPVQGE